MTPQDEADSMLEDTVPQHMDMENLGEHSDQASSALELSSASCITSTVTAGTSSRAEGKNVVEPLPLPPPPSVVGCSSGKGDEPHVVTEEELQQQASAAIVNGKMWKASLDTTASTTTPSDEEAPPWSSSQILDDTELGTAMDIEDTPEGDSPPLSIGAAAVKVSSAALLKGKDESDNARDGGSGGSDGESRDDPEAGADDGPTDDMLRKALREVVAGTADLGSITAKNIRRVMEERFSCNLENRKAFVKDVIITAVEDRAAAKEVPDSNSSNQPSGAEDEHNGDSDMSDGDAIIGAVAAAHAASAAVATATLASLSGADDDDDDGEDDDGETNEHAFDKSSSESEADGNDAAQLPVLPALDDTGEDSSASNSSETDDGAEEKSQSSPASLMPRPKARSTSARRALALAKLKRTVRGARSAAAAAAEGRMSNSEDSSDDNADSGAADSNSAKKMSYRRKKQQKLTSGGGSGEGRASGDDQGKDSVMSELDDNSRTSSSDSGSKGSAGSSGFSSGGSGKRRAKAKKTAKKAGAAAKRKLNAGKGKRGKKKTAGGAAGDKDGLSGLVDSDEEFANGPAASRDRAAKAAAKAVVQEELDDVNEEKMKERKRIAEERQRQLDALRVMDAAQLKEATRAQQGTLLAKIKERQSRVHAALAASAKEELKRLKAEARKAAGMVDEDDADVLRDDGVSEDGDGHDDEERVRGAALLGGPATAAVTVEKNVSCRVDGAGEAGDELAAKEEQAVAAAAVKLAAKRAAAAADEASEQDEESELSEEETKGGKEQGERTNEQGVRGAAADAAAESRRKEKQSDSEESFDSDSDDELEILPAARLAITPAAGILQKTQASIFSSALNSKSGSSKVNRIPPGKNAKNTNCTNSRNSHGGGGGGGGGSDAVTRALAALPKGVRFCSPKMADKSRAANRRRLAASARAVANNRWAAQLGYQDGVEHIRDLKYMELKRRQQAHHERERKEKENAVMAARLEEYAKHADEDEEELFGETGAAETADATDDAAATAAAATATTISTSGESAEKSIASHSTSGMVGARDATDGETAARSSLELSTPLAVGAQDSASAAPTAAPAANKPVPTEANEMPVDDGQEVTEQRVLSSPPATKSVADAETPTVAAEVFNANEGAEKEAAAATGEGDNTESSDGGLAEEGTPGRMSRGAKRTEEGMLGVDAAAAAATESAAPASLSSVSAVATAAKAPDAPGVARRVVSRTYGRKMRDVDGNVIAKGAKADLAAHPKAVADAAAADSAGAGDTGMLSADSQALWIEEPDSVALPVLLEDLEDGCHGEAADVTSEAESSGGGVGESCGLTLGLDEGDEETQRPLDSSKESILSTAKPETSASGVDAVAVIGGNSLAPSTDVPAQDETPVERGSGQKHNEESIDSGGGDRPAESGTKKRKHDEADDEPKPPTAAATDQGKEKDAVTTSAGATPASFTKMKIAADGSLAPAPVQRGLGAFFTKGDAGATTAALSKHPLTNAPPAQSKKGIAAFFSAGSDASVDVCEREDATATKNTVEKMTAAAASTPADAEVKAGIQDGVVCAEKGQGGPVPAVAAAETETTENGGSSGGLEEAPEKKNQEGEAGQKQEEEEEEEEDEEETKEPKDRSAKFRAMLEAEQLQVRQAKKLRKSGMMDEEAEEEEEEEAVRGLGDFGFGVPVGGNGTSATGTGGGAGDDEEEADEIRADDLEGIVDTYSDDEGDKAAQDTFLNDEAAAGDRQALKDMVRRVREGFGDERGGRGRSSAARGNLRLDELTAADRSSRKEARRLGLLNSDEEWSDDEKGKGEEDDLEELDEQQLGELLAKEQRARHMGLSQTAQEYLGSSDSEGEGHADDDAGAADGAAAEEDAERREEERVQKLWVKRAKRRRVLAEVEQSGAGGNSQSPELLMQEDEDSQAILSLLQCTNSRVGLGLNSNTMSMDGSTAPSNTTMSDSARVGPTGGGGGGGGGVAAAAAGSKRRGGRDDYSGELDAREVANGFGMGMSSKPLKRTKSEGSNPKDVTTAEARARMDRAFTMPQFVTSVKGFGGSGRAKQAQRKGSFLSRAGSLQARSGSLASGKTTVSASKFVFMSSSTTSMGGEDTSARTGFEEPAASDGSGGGGYGGGDKRPDISASGSNMSGSGGMSKGGVFSGIAGARKGAGGVAGAGAGRAGASRLWKGLRAESKSKSKSKR